MPPLSISPLMLDLGVYLPLPAEIVPSGTCDAPPEFVSCALALRTLAHIGRLKREGRELRRRRLAAGLSKGQAARLCGVSARQVYRWESGEREVPEWVWEWLNRGVQ